MGHTLGTGNQVNNREHTGNTRRTPGKMENTEGTPDTIGNTLGTGNRVNNTYCFYVGSVGPTAGGLPQVTHSEHKEQSGNTGGKVWERIGGNIVGNTQGLYTLGMQQTVGITEETHLKHTENNRNWEPSKHTGNTTNSGDHRGDTLETC